MKEVFIGVKIREKIKDSGIFWVFVAQDSKSQ